MNVTWLRDGFDIEAALDAFRAAARVGPGQVLDGAEAAAAGRLGEPVREAGRCLFAPRENQVTEFAFAGVMGR